jgi:hypothetical protein
MLEKGQRAKRMSHHRSFGLMKVVLLGWKICNVTAHWAPIYSGPSSAGTMAPEACDLIIGGASKRCAYPSGNDRTRPEASVTT